MVFILNLGKYISVPIISEWLELKDYMGFDSALGKVDRIRLIEQLKEYSHFFSLSFFTNVDNTFYSARAVPWASKRYLDLPVEVTNEFLKDFDEENAQYWNRVRTMKCINIDTCYMEKLTTILVFCESLESVIFRQPSLVDDYVYQMSVCCPKLKNVDLSYCLDLSDDAVIALCRGCPNLKSLELWKCLSLTNRVIFALIVHCRSIGYFRIDISGSRRDSEMIRFHMSQEGKTLDTVFDYMLGESYIQYGTVVVPEEESEQCNGEHQEVGEKEDEEQNEDQDNDNRYDSFGEDQGDEEGEMNAYLNDDGDGDD